MASSIGDDRFTVALEGNIVSDDRSPELPPFTRWVARFCGEWIGSSGRTESEARQIADDYKSATESDQYEFKQVTYTLVGHDHGPIRVQFKGTTNESKWLNISESTTRKIAALISAEAQGRHVSVETLTETEQFFYDHAGTSYNPTIETQEEGRIRGARDLAAAEARVKAGPYYVDHSPDDEPWDGDVPYDGPLWNVDLYSVSDTDSPTLLGSLGSVACEEGDPYMRVVAAELALEHLPKD